MCDLQELNARYAIPGQLEFVEAQEGFVIVVIENAEATASIALQGGQLLSYQLKDDELPLIWVSGQAKYSHGNAVRGGIPVCWPWFGAHATKADCPAHGFARTAPWRVVETSVRGPGETCIRLSLKTPRDEKYWPHDTVLSVEFCIGRKLSVELNTENHDDAPVTLTEALHTYFHISDIEAVRVMGLLGLEYYDKVRDAQGRQEQALSFTEEYDRVFFDAPGDCVIEDPGFNRKVLIRKWNSASTIVWNPWHEKAGAMEDMGEQGWRRMLCVESGNVMRNAVSLSPGASHSLCIEYTIEPL